MEMFQKEKTAVMIRISEENFRNFTAVSKDLWLILKPG